MQKRLRTLATLAAAAFATVGGAANIPQEWAVEVSRVKQYQFQANRGDTMELKATFWHNGEPFDLGGDTFRIYWQTNAMGSVYWSAPATAASNTVSAVFANTMDPGAPIVYGFLGATSGNYRASFSIRYAPGPGAVPNALPLPAATIDFAKVEVLNPPYYTKAETATAIREGIAVAASSATNYTDSTATTLRADISAAASSGTNYTDSTASTLRDDIAAASTLTPIYSDTPTFSEWTIIPQANITLTYSGDPTLGWIAYADEWGDWVPVEAPEDATELSFTGLDDVDYTATRTRTYAILGYQLGDQTDKPLQPMANYARASDITNTVTKAYVKALGLSAADVGASTPADVTVMIRDQSLGGIWDQDLEVWWTPVMVNGSLTYQATTNVNLNAEH